MQVIDEVQSRLSESQTSPINKNSQENEAVFEEKKSGDEEKEEEEPETREVLPYYNDPKAKIGVWTILKDIIHKDLSKIGLPIYFNDPTSML